MKTIVVLSDLHLGDPASALETRPGEEPDLLWLRNALQQFRIPKVDYLVLAGDVLDFSVASFERSYSVAHRFFTALHSLDLVEEIIYIPGNHDKDVWDSVQKEVNVFMRLREGRDPTEFPYEQPGIIDISDGTDGRLYLPGVNYARGRKRKKQYGALFLEGLFPKGEPLPISVVYPNLYLFLPEGKWILVTHGHLFELAWVFVTQVFRELLVSPPADSEPETLRETPVGGLNWLEQCNIPANSLICTGLGQGGPSTDLIRRMQAEVKQGKVNEISNVLRTFLKWLDDRLQYGFPKELAQDIFFAAIHKLAISEFEKYSNPRGSGNFLENRKDLVEDFLEATRLTVASLKPETVPPHAEDYPDCVIFGHTHLPILAENPQILDLSESPGSPPRISFLNTGSCLRGESAGIVSIDEKGTCFSLKVDFP